MMANFLFFNYSIRSCHILRFVPQHNFPKPSDIRKLQEFLDQCKKLLIITGAGVSTESGIPDYRSEVVGLYARTSHRPVRYQEFIKSNDIRQRYWARNYVSWPRFSSAQPNSSHLHLKWWEESERLHWLITQNVDALHLKAGSKKVTELHGTGFQVICLSCGHTISRINLQAVLKTLNPDWHAESLDIRPDGDIFLTDDQVKNFQMAFCEKCGGILKPNIIFFGENVPMDRVNKMFTKVNSCDALLIVGSSLQVYSSYRFVNRAYQQKKPITILNIGETRGDKMASTIVNCMCGDVFPKLTFERL